MRSAPELPRQLNLNQKKKKKHTKKEKLKRHYDVTSRKRTNMRSAPQLSRPRPRN